MFQCAEYDELIPPYSPAAEKASMREVFGATEDDVNRLRIVSLQEVNGQSQHGPVSHKLIHQHDAPQ